MLDSLSDSVPHQFETAATVTAYGHCKQSLTHAVNQSAGKIDCQQDAEDLQNGERLLIQVLQYEQVLPKQCSRGGMIGDQVNREWVGGCGRFLGDRTEGFSYVQS